jgi:diguanylate cyclase (GGDEF)-like protein
MRIYLLLRALATGTLAIYVILRNDSEPSWVLDLLLFNLVALLALFSLLASPIPDDQIGRVGISLAILSWTIGSAISSIDTFFDPVTIVDLELIAEVGYALFYPLALFGLSRAIRYKIASRSLEILDTLIIALGCTTIAAAFLIRPAMTSISGSSFEVFLSILYPVGDIVLLVTVVTLTVIQRFSIRNFLMIAGIGSYSLSDFYFLYSTQSGSYQFGSLTDIGWLIGFILISEAFWHGCDESQSPRTFNPAVATIALLGSSAILAIAVLQPEYFPRFLIVPAFATIALSFLRMGVAINDARNMSNEQILARTDELTGLANRRKFIVEFEEFLKSPGSVLILDLDGFKPVNDTRGHDVGDQLLSQVARRFERVIPHGSLLARLGGDEFGALIHGGDGLEIARALRATLSYPFHIAGAEITLDVSIGEATNTPGENLADQLMRRADEAMYEAKRSKRGVVAWHDQLGARGLRL